jgi:hypothetical protein
MSTNAYVPILFYSDKCANSKEVVGTIQALNKASLFRFVDVVTTPRQFLPPDLKSVPTLLFPQTKQMVVGKANIFAHLSKPVESRREIPAPRATPTQPAEPMFWSFNESALTTGYSSFDGQTKLPDDQLRYSYLDGEIRTSGQDIVTPSGTVDGEGGSKSGRNNDVTSRMESMQAVREAEFKPAARQ